MVYCINCGVKQSREAKYCPECGTQNRSIAHSIDSKKSSVDDKNKKSKLVPISILSGLALIGAASYYLPQFIEHSSITKTPISERQQAPKLSHEDASNLQSKVSPEIAEVPKEINDSDLKSSASKVKASVETPEQKAYKLANASGQISKLGLFLQNYPKSERRDEIESLVGSYVDRCVILRLVSGFNHQT